jgi:transcriptional regulator with PAS, ATPase and Fis domain
VGINIDEHATTVARTGRHDWLFPAKEAVMAESVRSVIEAELRDRTPSLLPQVERLALAASHDVTVLLTGETGTGKTHLARLIHSCSPRRNERLLTVACGALAPSLAESEFFGHVRGAFTGADRAKEGKFEAAGKGTLLLDEVDALGLEQQAKLLRVIETGEFEAVGSNETRLCEARVIAASNWNLEEAVERGKFRQDLYYRLNVLSFHLLPLRQRPQDVAALAGALVARAATKFGKAAPAITPEAVAVLQAFPWPGNVRQLENALQYAAMVCNGPELRPEHLPAQVREEAARRPVGVTPVPESLEESRRAADRAIIQQALAANGQSRTRAARALGVSRVTLYKRIKQLGLAGAAESGCSVSCA